MRPLPKKQQNTYILGAGAIGHLLACQYTLANLPVGLIHRHQAEADSEAVIFQDQHHHEHNLTLNYHLAADVTQIDYLLVAVKAHQLKTALLSVQHALHEQSHILLLPNGMGNLEVAMACLKDITKPSHIWPAINTHGCYLAANKRQRVIHSGIGEIHYGSNYKSNELVSSESFNMPSSLNASYARSIETNLWLKLAINAVINPLTAIHDCQNGDLDTDSDLSSKVAILVAEIADLYEKLNVQLTKSQIQKNCDAVIKATAKNYSSMQCDIKNKKTTEIEVITGYLLRYAKRMQFHMQEHQYLYQEIKNIEQGHKLEKQLLPK